ncbi:MAG: hydroxyacylglutathione hydrolase [Zoogloeaceae bacterium]|nr:hydroxyacylglutathione hydrolase [Zoogloeaceae bacterium]
MSGLAIEPIKAFDDNYIWMLRRGEDAVVVDPGDAGPVLATLEERGLRLQGILITHHHADHIGGIGELVARSPVPVFGPAASGIPGVDRRVVEGDRIFVMAGLAPFRVMEVPGHTLDHLAFYDGSHLFCGDTLFPCGCGRVFEGTMAQMHASLSRLAALPPTTEVYSAHEYSLANAVFALAVEPANVCLQDRQRWMTHCRADGQPTVPSLMGDELETNPFLRVEEAAVVQAARRAAGHPLSSPEEVFGALREWKNRF